MERKPQKLRNFCREQLKEFLKESNLHGLHYIGDETITAWERAFFLCAFCAALICTGNLVSYAHSKWKSTPIIIGTNPFPTSISDIPFPAITLCNMNQLSLKKVINYDAGSYEGILMERACFQEIRALHHNVSLNLTKQHFTFNDFMFEHSQPCSAMFLSCRFNAAQFKCSDLFEELLTDEGLCCVFNLVHPKFRHRGHAQLRRRAFIPSDGAEAVDWNPEEGFQKDLPNIFYPRTSDGIGVSTGLTVLLNAQVDDYYCSSTNGPGFKIDFHNPIEEPRMKDNALTISTGEETRFHLSVYGISTVQSAKDFSRSVRKCIFNDEKELIYYKFYTRKNCLNECHAHFVYDVCRCIPYYLPYVVANVTVCGVLQIHCVKRANRNWLKGRDDYVCRKNCFTNCFDLQYVANGFQAPLTDGNYMIETAPQIQNLSREYVKNNIALVNLYFDDLIFYGEIRNVYVGFNEFLANIGGLLGLFLGFSFISFVEVLYYGILQSISRWIHQKQNYTVPEKVYKKLNTIEGNNKKIAATTKQKIKKKKKQRKNGRINGWMINK